MPLIEKFKMADKPGKNIRSSITKSMFFKDIAGLLLQTHSVCIFLKKASHCGTFEGKIDWLDCIYTEIFFVKHLRKLGYLVSPSDFDAYCQCYKFRSPPRLEILMQPRHSNKIFNFRL